MSFYGGGDDNNKPTTSRRTWDKEEWEAKAKERQEKEFKERQSKGKFIREPTPPDAVSITARQGNLNLDENLNKITIVPANAAGIGKRGKGAGYYCESCNLTFKDSLQWVDHLNSRQHLQATGQTIHQDRATLSDVLSRLRWLKQKKHEKEKHQEYDIRSRIALRKKLEEDERQERKAKKLQRRKRKSRLKQQEQEQDDDDEQRAMQEMMGFKGFKT